MFKRNSEGFINAYYSPSCGFSAPLRNFLGGAPSLAKDESTKTSGEHAIGAVKAGTAAVVNAAEARREVNEAIKAHSKERKERQK